MFSLFPRHRCQKTVVKDKWEDREGPSAECGSFFDFENVVDYGLQMWLDGGGSAWWLVEENL